MPKSETTACTTWTAAVAVGCLLAVPAQARAQEMLDIYLIDVEGGGATLFVFPSYLETFGHPLLEAMASDVPLVAADIPVFREVAGDAALYADPHRPEALASAMVGR